MNIKKIKNNIDKSFQIEKDLLDDNISNMNEMICALCDSIDADFTVADEMFGQSNMIRLYNFNTEMFYYVNEEDFKVFNNGQVVKITGFLQDKDKKAFLDSLNN